MLRTHARKVDCHMILMLLGCFSFTMVSSWNVWHLEGGGRNTNTCSYPVSLDLKPPNEDFPTVGTFCLETDA